MNPVFTLLEYGESCCTKPVTPGQAGNLGSDPVAVKQINNCDQWPRSRMPLQIHQVGAASLGTNPAESLGRHQNMLFSCTRASVTHRGKKLRPSLAIARQCVR